MSIFSSNLKDTSIFLSAKCNLLFRAQYYLSLFTLLSFLMSMMLACGGAQVPSPKLYKKLSANPIELNQGDMDLSELTPTSSFDEEFQQASLGRSVTITKDGDGKNKLEPPTPCASLLPDRMRDDYRDRLAQVFDAYILQSLKGGSEQIEFSKIAYQFPVPPQTKEWTLISGHVGISRILSYVNDDELKYYDRCCQLTGSCGSKMVSKLYEVEADIRFLDRKDPALQSSLVAFEKRNQNKLGAAQLKKLSKRLYRDLAKKKPLKPQEKISHIAFRAIPKPASSPFGQLKLQVNPSSKIVCKKKKSKAASVVEFSLQIDNIEGAQATFGYEITTSKEWVDLSLAERKRLVQVGTGSVACYPGPDAFTNPDDRCPAKIVLTAFPPPCATLKGEGNFGWTVQVGIYAPGDRDRKVFHPQKSNTVITKVKRR